VDEVDCQFTAADFDAEVAQVSVREFGGKTYAKDSEGGPRSFYDCNDNMSNLGAGHVGLQGKQARKRESRLVNDGGNMVLKQNMYTMEEGEPSVYDKEAAGTREKSAKIQEAKKKASTRQIAGRDYEHQDFCLQCWDGGDLVCCDFCPAAYHLKCLGVQEADIPKLGWSCPQHSCAQCGRSAAAAGGLLFRCTACPDAFCEEHLPVAANVVGANFRFEELGCRQQKQACFVECGKGCARFLAEQRGEQLPEDEGEEADEAAEAAAAAAQQAVLLGGTAYNGFGDDEPGATTTSTTVQTGFHRPDRLRHR
jgi:SWI/SNF-related matrix-associated actin-dependent regulator of chromatin subfamily A member 5